MTFKQLGLSDKMLLALREVGYTTPSPIQTKVIPLAIGGLDIIGQAQTGTGKTASFAIPLIEQATPGEGIQGLILAPSRELAVQIFTEIRKLSVEHEINAVEIIGGISYDIQKRKVKSNPEIMVATPGRLIDLIESNRFPINLSKVKTFVLDEADEMLNFGFQKEILKLKAMLPKNHQTLLLTATFNKRTLDLGSKILNDPKTIEISGGLSTSANIEQRYIQMKEKSKLTNLVNILRLANPSSAIIFGRTRRRVDELTTALKELGFKAEGIQGDMRQRERSHAIAKFRSGDLNIIIGTDVIARGIDVDNVEMVFNFDLPTEIEYYTHRIGRTGRAKAKGIAVSFVKDSEMPYFREIMRKTKSQVKEFPIPTETDINEVRMTMMKSELGNFAKAGKAQFKSFAKKIERDYSSEELAAIVAGFYMKENKNVYNMKLTGETSASGKSKGRGRNRGGRGQSRRTSSSNSRGGNRGGSRGGGGRSNLSSSRGGGRSNNSGSRGNGGRGRSNPSGHKNKTKIGKK